jgi:tripartite-type tricarboxylate transporter receptor subunit TctC
MFAPAGVPKATLDVLAKAMGRTMANPDVRKKFEGDGFEPVGSTPEEFARFQPTEIAKWAKTIEMAGIKGQ